MSSPVQPGGSLVSPAALMRIRNLELRARVVVEGFWTGLHRSPYHGFSVEFTEYRQYSPGDDPRYVDWRVFGRTDRYFIKKFEDETNLRCLLLTDQSRSMSFGSQGYTKAEYAATLAATLAYFLNQQGDAVGVLTFDQRVRDYLPARHRPGHLRQLMLALEKPAGGTATDLVSPLEHVNDLVRKRGLMILISDFLLPLDRVEQTLSRMLAAGHELAAFQILDPREVDFDFDQASVFQDVETGQTLYVDPALARKEYRRRFEAHREAFASICRRLGARLVPLTTDRPLELVLFDFLRERARPGVRIRGGRR